MVENKDDEFSEQDLQDMLKMYYKRLFPRNVFYRWLSYGQSEYLCWKQSPWIWCRMFWFNQSIMPNSLFILLIQIYSSFVYFSLISWTVNIPKSWVFIHIGGWDLHSVFVIRKFDWIWEWLVGQKSIEDRYWCGNVNSTAWSSCW